MGDLDIRLTAVGATKIAETFLKNSVELPVVIGAIVATETLLLQSRVKGKASGRPGPNAPTGDYRRSISPQVRQKGALTEGEVGTNRPQGNRLEFGFHGTDSLGRHYSQPSFPHFGPALDETDGPFQEKLLTAVNKALG